MKGRTFTLWFSYGKYQFRKLVPLILVLFVLACEKKLDLSGENEEQPGKEEPVTEKKEFTVMSFNLRNEGKNDPQTLDQRKENIREIILDNDPDVFGVQELAADWMSEWLSQQLNEKGYDKYLSSGQFGSPKIIYYKRGRFTRTNQGTFQMEFSDNRAGTWVILLDKETNSRYFFCNSHWTNASSIDREKTANVVLNVVKANSKGVPAVVLGDFNSEPGSIEIGIIKNSSGLNLTCAHGDKGNTYHVWTGIGTKKIDWILHSEELLVTRASVVTTSFNGHYPSDHFPIKATFLLK
ncbi:endonuclease/exonuclease/phosphatase family protein [Maribellus sp. CM-23]|uniref:endonuclease/exonuclease/phosphatase family protein n=1 Tax=Maribellus sp. CM-23 TaxID=2781026 RepID=UPI001F1E5042|nr:endonuclease/exonuclease/phosphatase family protein [Maribellus sp. CM-23]MCE4564671.1 endonuclease/exonuclease/phosphatase family protein [Maribellus sp. CM-23]